MSPLMSSAGSVRTAATSAAAPAGSPPAFVVSSPRRTWTTTGRRFPAAAAVHLVRLERADEVARGIGRQARKLLLRFLDPVLAERTSSGRVRREEVGERIGLPHRDEEDVFGPAPAPHCRGRDPPVDVGETRGDLRGPRHADYLRVRAASRAESRAPFARASASWFSSRGT